MYVTFRDRTNDVQARIIGMSLYIKYNNETITTCGQITAAALSYDYSCSGDGNVVELSQEGQVGEQNIAEIEVYGVATEEPSSAAQGKLCQSGSLYSVAVIF